MPNARLPISLRQILLADAVTCAAMGILLTLAHDSIGSLTQIPELLLIYAGFSLFPIAVFMLLVALFWLHRPPAVWLVIAGNGLWVAGSLALISGLISVNIFGIAFIGIQALAVAALAWLEFVALKGALRDSGQAV
ncbi:MULTISPECIES: hypothetical protein [unclassified Microbulbifer]|uniref:hypothetical protein n=1 Tax=unclassified Microbulbifer TaxID=2619833 RepID=UPI0027E48A28|nr:MULTISPECIES: hypothetical protein [unclassified Microbulbifer]